DATARITVDAALALVRDRRGGATRLARVAVGVAVLAAHRLVLLGAHASRRDARAVGAAVTGAAGERARGAAHEEAVDVGDHFGVGRRERARRTREVVIGARERDLERLVPVARLGDVGTHQHRVVDDGAERLLEAQVIDRADRLDGVLARRTIRHVIRGGADRA